MEKFIKAQYISEGIPPGPVKGGTKEGSKDQDDKVPEEKGVPNFWLTAMKTNEVPAEEISKHDEEALKYLKDIKWCRIDDPKGSKLEFFFNPNPLRTLF
ncbi:Nucleosome assembly protein (NAP) [Dillenia turbinata]|uniref:Nucleosome assembly protein (NAP) n=1 Tax=Dillenia turbinata TaxID=194707 RepID=A0AAN8VY60_9MAGN